MRSAYDFSLATPEEDAQLRALLRKTTLPTEVEVSFEREPDFFAAASTQGEFHETYIARKRGEQEIVAMGSRAVRRGWIDGQEVPVGYLGDLRIAPGHRSRLLLARGYEYVLSRMADGRASTYFTAIFSDNSRALAALTSGRAGLPQYRDRGTLDCPSLIARPLPPERGDPTVERGTADMLPEIVACLHRHHSRRQFAPAHTEADFLAGNCWLGFGASDFLTVRTARGIDGVIGVWDQRAFKQTRVIAYHGRMRLLAALSRVFSRVPGVPRLPAPGGYLPSLAACGIAVDDDDPAIFRALLRAAVSEAAERGAGYLVAGLHQRDPLSAVFRKFQRVAFSARLFEVQPGDGAFTRAGIPYVEVGTL